MRALIIDDERLARQELKSLLAAIDRIEVVGECANADEAIASIEELQPDLVFLDIQMPGKNGFELLEELESVPDVIFVTAYDEYALKAFEVNAMDYLLKPVSTERLEEAILRLEERSDNREAEEGNTGKLTLSDQIFLKDGDKCWFVQLKDVKMFESEGNYVRVYFDNHKPLILRSLNNLEKRLDPRTFFRANRKFIMNLRWIAKVDTWFNGGLMVVLKDDTKVEISRRQAVRLKELMSL